MYINSKGKLTQLSEKQLNELREKFNGNLIPATDDEVISLLVEVREVTELNIDEIEGFIEDNSKTDDEIKDMQSRIIELEDELHRVSGRVDDVEADL